RGTLFADEEATRLLERCVGGLTRDMGEPGKGPYFPFFPPEAGPLGHYFYAYVFVAARALRVRPLPLLAAGPALKRYLPGDSNIVRFQERFEVGCVDTEPEDSPRALRLRRPGPAGG